MESTLSLSKNQSNSYALVTSGTSRMDKPTNNNNVKSTTQRGIDHRVKKQTTDTTDTADIPNITNITDTTDTLLSDLFNVSTPSPEQTSQILPLTSSQVIKEINNNKMVSTVIPVNRDKGPTSTEKITEITPTIPSAVDLCMCSQSSVLIDDLEMKELKEFIIEHEKLGSIFKTPDDLVHVLKVISLIQPHQRISTTDGVYIQSEITKSNPNNNNNDINPGADIGWFGWAKQKVQPLCLIRRIYGDDRISNIKTIKAILIASLIVIEVALQARDKMFMMTATTDKVTRNDITIKLKNEQLINKMTKSINKAVTGMQNLKETYNGDAHVCALIEMLTETINDRLELIAKSLEFLK